MNAPGAAASPDLRDKLKQALGRIAQLNAELAEARRAAGEPIAVVGLGCRFPGGGVGPERFWEVLRDGVDATTDFPKDRWSPADYFDPDPEAPGKAYTLRAAYVEDADAFDPHLFGISPREAVGMDPQQRLALEVSWEALEDAGMAPDRLRGRRGGVFLGVSTSDYVRLRQQHGHPDDVDAYQLVGELSFVAGRISYTYGLRGPSQVVDTACSSSLVALHLACQSLRRGEADFALAGGVNLILSPYGFVLVSKAQALSPEGRCKTFDVTADGYARGEGCGVLVLKRLSDARRDSDRVLAIVRGTAVNHDGRSSGLTVPSGEAQQEVIRSALSDAGLDASDVGYVEAHGTGTPLGDPIELRALDAVYGRGRDADQPLLVGSVKTNVGHLEAAAGVVGVVKAVLALSHRHIPPHLHLRTPNPNVDWDRLGVRVPTQGLDWESATSRRAGVSSFGASGTNAHVVLEEAGSGAPAEDVVRPGRGTWVLPLSAKGEDALRAQASTYAAHLRTATEVDLSAFCVAAALGRARLPDRLAVVGSTPGELAEGLEAFVAGSRAPDVATVTVKGGGRVKVGFLFSGQGSQYPGMGKVLYDSEPVFRAALDRCDQILGEHLEGSVVEVMHAPGGDERLRETGWLQPALFSLEYALSELWASWGVHPAAVLGHSVGEYVAACVAGVLALEDGLRLVAVRGRLMQALPAGGAMAAIGVEPGALDDVLAQAGDALALAAVNGPRDVVVAGTEEAVGAAVTTFAEQGARARRLEVSHAFHSALVEPILEAFRQEVEGVEFSTPTIPLVSNVTGKPVDPDTLADPEYWVRHTRDCVRFADGVAALETLGCSTLLEIGPSRTLLGMAAACLGQERAGLVSSLRKDRDDTRQVLLGLGQLSARGVEVDWERLYGPRAAVALPTYPFQRQRYWFDVPEQARASDGWLYELCWQEARQPELAGHVPAAVEGVAHEGGSALVFADAGGLGERLAATLAAAGRSPTLVRQGSTYEPGGDTITMDPADPEHWAQLRTDVIAGGVSTVAFLWGLDGPTGEATTVEALRDGRAAGVDALVRLVQVLHAEDTGRLWVVTRGAQPAGHAPAGLCVAAAPLWGLGRVISMEHPNRYGGLVDLEADAVAGEGEAALLAAEITGGDGEDQVAIREGRRLVPRIVPSPPDASARPEPLRPEGAYLITGGLGGLGLTVARWLVSQGVRHITITSRGGLAEHTSEDFDDGTNERIEAVRALREGGATVEVAQADAADPEQMAAVVAALRASPGGLRGVIHAAGVSEPQELVDVDLDTLHAVLRPKVEGAWILHELTAGDDLDCFLLFSSIASAWGSQHVGSYAAANLFLDALAHHRQTFGLAATSVNWGPWMVESGLGDDEVLRFLQSVGLRPFDPEPALDVLADLVGAGAPQTVVADVDWATFKPMYEARQARPLLEAIELGPANAPAEGERSEALEQVLAAGADERLGLLVTHLREELASVLRLAPGEVELDTDITGLGLDSLMAMEVIGSCKRAFGVTLLPGPLFEHPHLRGWSEHLYSQIEETHGPAPAEPSGTAAGEPEASPQDALARAGHDPSGGRDEGGEDWTDPRFLERFVQLDAGIVPLGGGVADQRAPGAVMLTGATGFVGAFLLAELLARTDADVHCLVRAPDAPAAAARVRDALTGYGLPTGGLDDRVVCVPGDLTQPRLGLGDAAYAELALAVGGIYHAGAAVNFTQPYAQLAPGNVTGTVEILRLACTGRQKVVNHVSTYGVWGMVDPAVELVGEDDDIAGAGRLINGYVQSKWVAERVVDLAVQRGIPVRTFRPGRVMGDRRTGACLTTSFTCRIIKGCIQLGMAPRLDKAVEMTPVCYVAEALVHIARYAEPGPGAYHLVNPATIDFDALTGHIRRRGWPLEPVEPARWWEALVEGLDEPGSNDLHPLMDGVAELLDGGEELVAFGTANTDAALQGSGVQCPPLDERLLDTYFDYFLRTGYLDQPQRSGA